MVSHCRIRGHRCVLAGNPVKSFNNVGRLQTHPHMKATKTNPNKQNRTAVRSCGMSQNSGAQDSPGSAVSSRSWYLRAQASRPQRQLALPHPRSPAARSRDRPWRWSPVSSPQIIRELRSNIVDIQGGHRILNRDIIVGPTRVRISDTCPLALPEMLTVAHAGVETMVGYIPLRRRQRGSHDKASRLSHPLATQFRKM